MLTYEHFINKPISIAYEYCPIKHQPKYSVTYLNNCKKKDVDVLCIVDREILRKFCYDAKFGELNGV